MNKICIEQCLYKFKFKGESISFDAAFTNIAVNTWLTRNVGRNFNNNNSKPRIIKNHVLIHLRPPLCKTKRHQKIKWTQNNNINKIQAGPRRDGIFERRIKPFCKAQRIFSVNITLYCSKTAIDILQRYILNSTFKVGFF